MWKGLDTVNLAHIIDAHPADRAALVSRSRVTTYGTLREQVARVRGGLAAVGVGQGDRVALLCSNGRYFVDVYLAALGLGAVVVPLNPTSPSPEIVREIAAAAPSVVVFDPSVASAWARVDRASVPSVRHVVITEQPVGADGDFRFNTDLNQFEGYANGGWSQFSLAGGVLTFSGGTTGLTPASPTNGNIVLGGTLNVANGGTGATTQSGAQSNLNVPSASGADRKSTRLNSSHTDISRMPSSA